jgi:hypothetical protein
MQRVDPEALSGWDVGGDSDGDFGAHYRSQDRHDRGANGVSNGRNGGSRPAPPPRVPASRRQAAEAAVQPPPVRTDGKLVMGMSAWAGVLAAKKS